MEHKDKKGKPLPGWKDPSKRAQQPSFPQASFVQYELSKEQLLTCKSWSFSADDGWHYLVQFEEAGYKVTFRTDDKNDCSACWIIGGEGHTINPNMILAGRGSSPFKAFKQVCFKHNLFDGQWGDYIQKKGKEEIDD